MNRGCKDPLLERVVGAEVGNKVGCGLVVGLEQVEECRAELEVGDVLFDSKKRHDVARVVVDDV